ncbi:MAG: hypothetical protein LBQ61_00735 [Spirochaetales bacterium]|jgi:uncharacterized alkaline shock family protein YloU|nr:hypothetical protein [Spirochaetales bacterium]
MVGRILKYFYWLFKGIKVYALVGRSGTGKSFRSQLVAEKYNIDLIIDDGLLIQQQKILAGKSAKKEAAYLGAIKTALFDDPSHRQEVKEAIKDSRFKAILIVGTSEKMINKIVTRLDLPDVNRWIKIEDISTEEEIGLAVRSRNAEGKHIIPVPAMEIGWDHGGIFHDTINVFLKNRFRPKTRSKVFEKTVVRPEFDRKGSVSISQSALAQMIMHCADEFDSSLAITKISVREGDRGYRIFLGIRAPYGVHVSGKLHDLQSYIINHIERYTGIMIEKVDLRIETLGN